MRIALVTETYPPEVNGVAMSLQRLVAGLRGRGHRVDVIRPRQSRDDPGAQSAEGDEILVPGLPLPGYPGLHLGLPAYRRLKRLWRAQRPDVVHIATEGPLGWGARQAARGLGLPLSTSFHTNFHTYSGHYASAWFRSSTLAVLRRFHNGAQVTLVPSDGIREELTTAGFQNVGLLGRGVDTALFGPHRRDPALRRRWGVDDDTPVAIYVGRIAAEKNLPLTLAAYQAAREVEPRLRLVMVGDGPLRQSWQVKHPDVIWAGVQHGEDLARHYASGDFFPFASTSETFGNVVTEAMASGLLVLAYDYAAPRRYLIDGVNGHLVPFNDAPAFTTAARRLLTEQPAWPARRAAARTTAEGISWPAVVLTFEQILTRVSRRQPPLAAGG